MVETYTTLQLAILYLAGFVVGASIGSFVGCALYRVPRGLSLLQGRSACPACGHKLRPAELIPVASYLWQQGQAACCGVRLSRSYFKAELACGLAGLAIVWLALHLTA